jgi:hypothetical protein
MCSYFVYDTKFHRRFCKVTKTDYDPDRSLVLIEGLYHFLTNFLQNLASCQISFMLGKCEF